MDNKSNSPLRLLNINVRSLLPSFVNFTQLVNDTYDIICVTETWLKNEIPSDLISLPGYTFYRKDRQNRVGGGVGVYARSNFQCNIVDVNINNLNFEYLFLEVTFGVYRLAVITIYRPPQTKQSELVNFVDEIAPQILVNYDYSIITGDLNIDMLKPNLLFSTLHDFGFHQLINEPTRVASTSTTCLDPIFVNSTAVVSKSGTIDSDISDHNRVPFCILNIKTNKNKHIFISIRDYKNLDLHDFENDLNNINWNNIFYIENINDKVRFLESNIVFLFNKHAPLKTIRVSKPPAPWLTDNLKLIYKQRDKAVVRYKRDKTLNNWSHYKELRNFALASTRREKAAYIEKLERDKVSKKLWQGLRNLNIKNSSNDNAKLPPTLCDPNAINDYFVSVFNKSQNCADNTEYYMNNQFSDKKFEFHLVDQLTIKKIIHNIRSNASGCDGITLQMLQCCLPQILDHITNVVNSCLEAGYFPQPWRESIVCPIPKVSNPEALQDLRPISLLPVVSKVLERVVYVQLSQYLIKNNILPVHQSGFREGHSTTTALLSITDNIARALDKKLAAILIALDYSKAFDVIDHDLLVAKLKFYGCDDIALSFFKSYLWRRTQRVRINCSYSDPKNIISGVPQGSILGPLLFLLYTCDLPASVKESEVYQFADDTQMIYYFDPDDVETASGSISGDLGSIITYSTEHNLIINSNKTKVLLFSSENHRPNIENNINIVISGDHLFFSENVKILGLNLDPSLRFREHIRVILQKCYLRLRLLYANKSILNFKTRKKLADSLVLSIINYCLIVYYPYLDQMSQQRLQRIQNACCRFVCGLRKFDRVSIHIYELKWLKVSFLFKFLLLSFMYRLFKNQVPKYLLEKIIPRNQVHNINIRHNTLTMPHHSTALFTRSYTFNVVSIYNQFRPNLHCSFHQFRKMYKHLFLEEQLLT